MSNGCAYRTPSKNNLDNHVEKVHREEKFYNTFVVPNVIVKSKSGTNYIFCALMVWFEVFVWISAHLRFHKMIFWIDDESEISKVEVNFSVKSVRELKCLHNFRIKQRSWWNYISKELGTTNVFRYFSSEWALTMCFFTFLLDGVL